MKISIITVCYNREHTIKECIESVLSQDYDNIEYIIVDGASTDSTMDIINQYRDRIATIISEPDHNLYEAINKGIRIATGDVIGLLHSDDYLFDNNVITKIAKTIHETGCDFLYGNGLIINEKNKVVRKWISGSYRLWKIRHGWLPMHTSCYIRKKVIEKKGNYNETYSIAADTELLLRYLITGDLIVVNINQYVVKMRMGGISTNRQKIKQLWLEDFRAYRSHGLNPVLSRIEKICWKIPQFIKAKFM